MRGKKIIFRGLVTEVSPLDHWQWLLFLYVVTEFEGTLSEDLREGRLKWVPLSDLASLPIPQSDALFGPAVLDLQAPFFEAMMHFDHNLELINAQIY